MTLVPRDRVLVGVFSMFLFYSSLLLFELFGEPTSSPGTKLNHTHHLPTETNLRPSPVRVDTLLIFFFSSRVPRLEGKGGGDRILFATMRE